MSRQIRFGAIAGILALLGVGCLIGADVPAASDSMIHACVNAVGQVTVINFDGGERCAEADHAVKWAAEEDTKEPPSTTTTTEATTTTTTSPTGDFPNASNTGFSGELTDYTGGDIHADGTVVENKLLTSSIGVYADDVVFRNCKFVYTGALDADFTMVLVQGRRARFEDVEFDGQGKVARAIEADNDTLDAGVTVLRANIHDVGNGVEGQGPMTVHDSYIHSIFEAPGTDWHADGLQTPRSSDDIDIVHNTIISGVRQEDGSVLPATSAINIQGSDSDPAERVLIQNNLLAGGGFTVYAGPGGPGLNAYRILDNHFSSRVYPPDPGDAPTYGDFGPFSSDFGFTNVVATGNVDDETGEPVELS